MRQSDAPNRLEPHPTESTDYLSLEAFFKAFHSFSLRVKHRIFKLERLQEYVEADNASWYEFQNGNVEHSLVLMRDIRAAESDFDTDFFRRGLQFLRVRAIERPLTRYIEWELQAHIVSAQYGETILVADLTDASRDSISWNSRDFLLFDSFGVLIHDYDAEGVLRGGWISQDESLITRCSDIASDLTMQSTPLAVFMRNHPSRYVT